MKKRLFSKNKNLLIRVRKILRTMGIGLRVRYVKSYDRAPIGYAHGRKGIITLNIIKGFGLSVDDVLTTIFHEAAHIICYRKKIYWNYHRSASIKTLRKLALRAERYVDLVGCCMMRQYFKGIQYQFSYLGEKGKNFLQKYYS